MLPCCTLSLCGEILRYDLHRLHHLHHLQWPPMKQKDFVKIKEVFYCVKLKDMHMLKTCSLISPPPMTSYGLQWSEPFSSRQAVSNLHLPWPHMGSKGQSHSAQDMQSQISTSHGLLWAPMVRAIQLQTSSLKSPPPMASYGLQ